MQRGFIQIPILIAIIAGILVVGGAGYLVVKKVNKPAQVVPSEEVLKNSSEESTTTKVDVDSAYLKEEMARKRQRDEDREKCIANVEMKIDQCRADGGSITQRTICMGPGTKDEQIDRCYLRFPNN